MDSYSTEMQDWGHMMDVNIYATGLAQHKSGREEQGGSLTLFDLWLCKIYSISFLHFFLISAPPFYFLSIPFISIPSSTSYSIYSDWVDQERGGAWNLITVWHVTFPHNFIAKSRVCNQATRHTVTVTSHTVT